MCGIACLVGPIDNKKASLGKMLDVLEHRGPDSRGLWLSDGGTIAIGHLRLRIIDKNSRGDQPMVDNSGNYVIAFNGEIYNYRSLREELSREYDFRTATDTEVVLAAYIRWGISCLEKFLGMFAFVIWDNVSQTLIGARDRFGVKPLYIAELQNGTAAIASEIKALHAAGVRPQLSATTWSKYLGLGVYDDSNETFWEGIFKLGSGSVVEINRRGAIKTWKWYEPELIEDNRSIKEIEEETIELLRDSVKLRLIADVNVGFCLSGGLDSSLLLQLAAEEMVGKTNLKTFTFFTSHNEYDERSSARRSAYKLGAEINECEIRAVDIPQRTIEMHHFQDEPFGGLPTLGMGLIFERAHQLGIRVILDGNGIDEAWAGYDHYLKLDRHSDDVFSTRILRDHFLTPEFAANIAQHSGLHQNGDRLRSRQMIDTFIIKLPRALRFLDRASMAFSVEAREPFLDHRLVELGIRQRFENKIRDSKGKWLVRSISKRFLDTDFADRSKRVVQTPQREWLRLDLSDWVGDCIDTAINTYGGSWLDVDTTRTEWAEYRTRGDVNSFHIWQLISLAHMVNLSSERSRSLKE